MKNSILTFAASLLSITTLFAADRPNVLFIAVDDLRPELGCYGNTIVKTPNIDRIAARGIVFNKAYCQQAVCSPSRTSLMTGLRPDATKVWDLNTHFRVEQPDCVTLPQYFKSNGYHCSALSKIYHNGFEDGRSWSEPHWYSAGRSVDTDLLDHTKKIVTKHDTVVEEYSAPLEKADKAAKRGPAFEVSLKAEHELPDGATAAEAVKRLSALKSKAEPFFLAVGFAKPHLPFVAPKKYWDLYTPNSIPVPTIDHLPVGSPEFAGHKNGELHNYPGVPKEEPIPTDFARTLRHGYYACVSYTDAQIGKVLDALDKEGLSDNTIIVLWGDHGWQLGDHGLWHKHTNFELAVRAPLLISVPKSKTAGMKCDAPVEFVDIYPTLADICGLPIPTKIDGTSLKYFIADPSAAATRVAISQYPRRDTATGTDVMGYSIRDSRWRAIFWRDRNGPSIIATELYDEQNDPGETVSLASKPEHKALMESFAMHLPPVGSSAIEGKSSKSKKAKAADHPNILWITSEDHGPEMGCYGDSLARTSNVDALAAKGMIFKHAWSVAPVCAPARTAIISGMYPSSSGGLHMRSMVSMPAGTKMGPQYLREVGYYCTNNSKTDYNLREPGKVWDDSTNKAHWRSRSEGQPFFAIFNSTKSHESQIRTRPHEQITDPAKVRVPKYHPDTPEVRQDWAQYYDKVSEADADAGLHLKELAEAGLADNTIVFYYGDHGSGMPRSKRWPSNSGLHVPMVVYFPKKWEHLAPREYKAGGVSNRLVSFVDLAPTVLSLAGVKPPEWMQGNAFAGPHQSQPQPFIYGQRGRMDERMDGVRSVTDGRYVYLRNYFPNVSQAQRVAYQFDTPTTRVWNDLFLAGKTNEAQSIFWRVPKAVEELYDLNSDVDEVHNLAQSPEHRLILEKFRDAQREHVLKIRDVCFLPEREIHTRSEGSTPYEMAHDPAKYPLERIVAAAELSSRLDPADVNELLALLKDRDSAVRYWGALGLLMRGPATVSSNKSALKASLADESPSVRIVAAQALGLYGDSESTVLALNTLAALASPESNGVLISMPALEAIESLGDVAKPLHGGIATLNPNGPSPDQRYGSYVPRLIANIVPDAKPSGGKSNAKARVKAK